MPGQLSGDIKNPLGYVAGSPYYLNMSFADIIANLTDEAELFFLGENATALVENYTIWFNE